MTVNIQNLCKSFSSGLLLDHLNLQLDSSKCYCLMGPSGRGKTTLLRILMGLETADSGTISGLEQSRIGVVFQEDRLCETFSPIDNVRLVTDLPADQVRIELSRLLPEESLPRPVSTLSGGMKRRTAICRALLAPCDILLMDEPFTGLDQQTKAVAIQYLLEKSAGKLLLLSTHQEEDAKLLGAEIIRL